MYRFYAGLILIVVFITGIATCYISLAYDYVPCIKVKGDTSFMLEDSTLVEPFIVLDWSTIRCNLNFEEIKNNIYIQSLSTKLISTEHPNQEINLSRVYTYKNESDTVMSYGEQVYGLRIWTSTYDDVPEKYKWVSTNREKNFYVFQIKVDDIEASKNYLLKIKMVYSIGYIEFEIEREIPIRRKMELVPYRMMT